MKISLNMCRDSYRGTSVLQPQLIYFCNVAVAARKTKIDLVKKVLISDVVATSLQCVRTLLSKSLFREYMRRDQSAPPASPP